ncbi:MAG: DUF2059 domain-containing protein [Candidatus Omnitrophota bacterium]
MKSILYIICFLLVSSTVFAEKINFKDGRSIIAKILQKDAQSVKVDLNGLTMTYYVDEIKDIDGQLLVAPAVVPKPAVSSQPALVSTLSPVKTSPDLVIDDPVEKRALILKFIEVFGTRKAMITNFNIMLNTAAKQKPEEVSKIRERFKIDEIIERLIPLYDKHFTSEDLKVYIDFYSSEHGQKLFSGIREVMKESITIGVTYLKEKFPEIDDKK